MKRSWLANLVCILLVWHCTVFQKKVKITPAPFDYESIAENYFSKGDEKPLPLTVQKGNNLYNSTTLDGRYLFYTTDHSGNYDIWFRDLKSAIIVPVTEHPAPEYKPAISPDGKKLVFVSEENDSSGDIVLIEIDPSNLMKKHLSGNREFVEKKVFLTNRDFSDSQKRDNYSDTDPAWAPDSKRVVFASDRFSPGLQNLVLIDLSNPEKMTQITQKGAASPQFSFDGKSIVYLSFQDSKEGEIYRLNLENNLEERLTKDSFMNFSPSMSPDGNNLYYTSIRKDSNKNGILDLGDNSLIIKLDLINKEEKVLTTDSGSVFDTKFSFFNKGSILYSAALYNTINIYFIPESGTIPKRANIDDQLNFALRIKKTQDNYFLALDSVKLFFKSHPLFPIYEAKVRDYKAEYWLEKGQKKEAKEILDNMLTFQNDTVNALSYALGIRRLDRSQGKISDSKLFDYYNKIKSQNADIQVLASILKLVAGEKEKAKDIQTAKSHYELILKTYPDYFEKREVKRKLAKLEFAPNSNIIPERYFELMSDSSVSLEDLRLILNDLETKISSDKNYVETIKYTDKILELNKLKERSKPLFNLVTYIKSKALNEGKRFKESNIALDSFLDPVQKNPECDFNPFCKKFLVCGKNPICLKSHLLKSKNFESMGSVAGSFDELRIFLENYDSELGVELNKTEMEKTFRYYEAKAKDHEARGNSSIEERLHLRDAAFHYFFNVENMYLLKEKNLFVDDLYKDYAVYYQRKMVDSIFNYAQKQAQDKSTTLLDKLNVLGKDNLNVLGRSTSALSTLADNKLTNFLKFLGDFRDLKNDTILGKPGEPDDAMKILDQHFNLSRPRARPVLYLASLYGYSYYLINKSLIYETHYRTTGAMTVARKESILRDLRNAENELKWIIFADPLYADAHQLLGWLYQYIDIFKSSKPSPEENSDGEKYADTYEKYFPEKHFEENINLYKQVLDMLGNIPNKKILSDLNLNLANNYLLLQNYPKAKEHYAKVEKYGENIVEQIQFENYKQTALFNYNYARSLISMGEYQKASQYLEKTAEIYYDNEYYEEVGKNPSGLNQNKKQKIIYEVNNKLVLIYSLLGLAQREAGNYVNAINAYKKALALNFNSGYVNNINIYSSLALCYQKVEKYHLSDYYISKVEIEYKKFKAKERFKFPSIPDKLWNLILPDRVRIIGASRFPGEFEPEEHYLLAQGIKIQNRTEQGEFEDVEKEILAREEFLKDTGLNKLIVGEEISLIAKHKIGYDYYSQGKYAKALSHYNEFLELVNTKKVKSSNYTKEKRQVLQRKSYSLFRLIETSRASHKKLLFVLRDHINDLMQEKNSFVQTCVQNSKLSKRRGDLEKVCEENFDRTWYIFDPLLGLSYFYLAEVLNSRGEYDSAFYYYGLSIPLLKDPAEIPVENIGLPGDLFLKTDRLRLKINLAIVYYRIGDEKQFNATIKETEELASEFQAVEDYVKIKLLKAKFLFAKAKTNQELNNVLQELNFAEKQMFKSHASLIELEDNVISELYGLFQSTYFKLGNWREVHSKEEKLYNVLLFNHFQNTRVIFEEDKLEGLSQYTRELIRKDSDNNAKYKLLVNTRKPLSKLLNSRTEINSEIERVLSLIQKYFPEKKVFFEVKDSTKPDNLSQSQTIIRFIRVENSFVINYIKNGKENFYSLPIKEDINKTLSAYFSDIVKNNLDSVTIIPDKSLANFDFGSILIQDKPLSSIVKINYAYTMRQVNPIHHNNIRFTHIINTSKLKDDKDYIENDRLIETKNSKKLGAVLNDSDILNTEINYSNGNIFSPSIKGFINLKEFAEKNVSLSLVVLNQTKFDSNSFFRTIATFDVIQSSGVPIILAIEGNDINPQKIISFESIQNQSGKIIGFNESPLKNPNQLNYSILKDAALKMERQKKYRQALSLFLQADILVSPLSSEEKLESDLNLARIKSKTIPKMKRFVFYERLLKKYNSSKPDKILIYESLLHQCYVQFSNQYCRDHFKKYYKTLKSTTELDSETRERSKILVNFYIQVNNGSVQNLERNYQNFLKSVSFADLFLFHEDMGKLFLKNFILDKAEFHAKQLLKMTSEKEEKEIATSLLNEIELQSYFTGKSNSFDLQNQSESIYKDGISKKWNDVEEKIKLLDRKTYDDVLIKYRQRLFTIWRKINLGSEYNPLQLISETSSTGKSAYSLINRTDRTLLFNLLVHSIQFQVNTEVNTVFDAFLDLQNEESKKIQNTYMKMLWAEELFTRGDYKNTEKYIEKLEIDLEKFSYDPNLLSRFQFLKYKTYLMTDDSGKKIKNLNKRMLEVDNEWYPFYIQSLSSDVTQLIPLLNQFLIKNSDKVFENSNKREFLDFITHLERLAFRQDNSEIFLDLAFYRDKVENMGRFYKNSILFSQVPRAENFTSALLKKIPPNQEFIAVVNFGLQTFAIKIENGGSNGELAFSDNREIKNDIFNYHKQVREKGSSVLLRDYLESKFRNKILLNKKKLSYLYLSSFFIKAPLELKEDDNFYIVLNPNLLLNREIRKNSDYFNGNFSIKKYQSSFGIDKELTRLENLEIKESNGTSSNAFIFGEKLNLSDETILQYGKTPLIEYRSDERKGAWILSNSDLYETSFYKDDINLSLNYLDKYHYGPGVFSISRQLNTANIYFMKSLFLRTSLQMNLRTRFLESLKAVKNKYPQEINWNGYRLYTNTLLEE